MDLIPVRTPRGLMVPALDSSEILLIEKYRPLVYRWTRNLLKQSDEAEDLCQEICLRALTGNYSGKAEYTTWLYRIAANACKDLLRKKRRNKEVVIGGDEIPECERYFSVSKPILPNEFFLRFRIIETLELLTQSQKKILCWKYIKGYSNIEIAQQLGIAETSASRSLRRAREAFKSLYMHH